MRASRGVDDFVVFVPFVLVGEVVEAEITEVKKSFARARLVRVTQPSPERVLPACAHFGACGGCQYQHVAYPAQLRLKRKQVADLFQRIGGLPPELVAPVVPCPQPYGYRNRIMIRSQWNKPEQRLNIGFVRADCGLVEDIFDVPDRRAGAQRTDSARPRESAAQGRDQSRVAHSARELGSAARFLFPE